MYLKEVRYALLTAWFLLCSLWCQGQAFTDQKITTLIPIPKKVQYGQGTYPLHMENVRLGVEQKEQKLFANEIAYLKEVLPLKRGFVSTKDATIRLVYDAGIDRCAYRLEVDKQGVSLCAKEPVGMFYAMQTLRQLLLEPQTGVYKLPIVSIEDQPARAWRGLGLDVSRHLFTLEEMFQIIDLLATYKLNKLHLHLTDDQGWRMEIKKYPKLTKEGGWRRLNRFDSTCIKRSATDPDFLLNPVHLRQKAGFTEYGGYYTQRDLKKIIAYAASRHIEVIPEIDMPGHMAAAIASYPELIDGNPPLMGEVFTTPICPCKPATLQFVKDVLKEVMDVFPSTYMHIGVDEVDKSSWDRAKSCDILKEKEQLDDVLDIQTWFVKELNSFIRAQGKTTICWDDAFEGTALDKNILMMYWRDWVKEAPEKALTKGNEVVITPVNPLYFFYMPKEDTFSDIYHMPIDERTKGVQATIWTEIVPSLARLQRIVLPRLAPMAERAWVEKPTNFEAFEERLQRHYTWWDASGIKYGLPE